MLSDMRTEAIGWVETIEFVDSSGIVVREARYFAYPKNPPPFPTQINGELPEGLFVREKYSQLSRITRTDQLDRLTAYYETTEWRCVRV